MSVIDDLAQKVSAKKDEIEGNLDQKFGGVKGGITGAFKKMKGRIKDTAANADLSAREETA